MSHEFNFTEELESPIFEIEQPFDIEPILDLGLSTEDDYSIDIIVNKKPIFEEQSLFFFVPDEPPFLRENFKGLQFEGVQYTWDEFDYRLNVDVPSVPEPADAGLAMGIILGLMILYKIFMKEGTTQMKCSICKTKDSIVSFIKSIYNKLTGGK